VRQYSLSSSNLPPSLIFYLASSARPQERALASLLRLSPRHWPRAVAAFQLHPPPHAAPHDPVPGRSRERVEGEAEQAQERSGIGRQQRSASGATGSVLVRLRPRRTSSDHRLHHAAAALHRDTSGAAVPDHDALECSTSPMTTSALDAARTALVKRPGWTSAVVSRVSSSRGGATACGRRWVNPGREHRVRRGGLRNGGDEDAHESVAAAQGDLQHQAVGARMLDEDTAAPPAFPQKSKSPSGAAASLLHHHTDVPMDASVWAGLPDDLLLEVLARVLPFLLFRLRPVSRSPADGRPSSTTRPSSQRTPRCPPTAPASSPSLGVVAPTPCPTAAC